MPIAGFWLRLRRRRLHIRHVAPLPLAWRPRRLRLRRTSARASGAAWASSWLRRQRVAPRTATRGSCRRTRRSWAIKRNYRRMSSLLRESRPAAHVTRLRRGAWLARNHRSRSRQVVRRRARRKRRGDVVRGVIVVGAAGDAAREGEAQDEGEVRDRAEYLCLEPSDFIRASRRSAFATSCKAGAVTLAEARLFGVYKLDARAEQCTCRGTVNGDGLFWTHTTRPHIHLFRHRELLLALVPAGAARTGDATSAMVLNDGRVATSQPQDMASGPT